jgi:hypothetical protein
MKRILVLIFLTIFLYPVFLSGQMATRQAGIRAGYRSGIFYQVTDYTGNAETGYNFMLGFNNNGIQFTGLRIVYGTSINEISPDLFFAWGYGGHAGFINTDHLGYMGERYYFERERFCPLLGADGWLAAEYRFREIPLNISLNVKPFIELTIPAFFRFMPVDIGISVSYIF